MCASAGTVLANGVNLAGHVTIGDNATIGAFTGVHQFCRVGRESFIGGYSVVTQDVMPFASVTSDREIAVFGANRVGLERRGFARDAIESSADGHSSAHARGTQYLPGGGANRAEVPPCAGAGRTAPVHWLFGTRSHQVDDSTA